MAWSFLYIEMKYKFIAIIVFLILYFAFYNNGVTCVIKCLFGIECLGCGYTRALIQALKLNFKDAFSLHPMFWSFPILLVYFFFDGKVFKNRTVNYLIPFFVLVGFILNWFFKI